MKMFPFAPLIPIIETRYRKSSYVSHVSIHGKAVRVLGCHRRTATRWTRNGMSRQSADRAAVALGLHPASIWPEWFQS